MSDLSELYEDLIKDHSRRPRNYHKLENATKTVEGYNPLCGDRYTLYLQMDGDKIADIAFEGEGCAISKSSASIMTQALKGKTRAEAEKLFGTFHQLLTSDPDKEFDLETLGKLAVFSGVRKFPVRIKCATLAWHTLNEALHGNDEKVSTE